MLRLFWLVIEPAFRQHIRRNPVKRGLTPVRKIKCNASFFRSLLRFLRRPQQNLAGKRLRSLRHDHGHGVRHIRGL